MKHWLLALVGLFTLVAVGCSRSGSPDAGSPAAPPQLTLQKDRKDLLFTYVDAEGKLHDVDGADKVPEDRRKQVLVRDLSKGAEELKADQYVYVADLTRDENGAWPYTVVSRYGIDRSLRDGDFQAVDEPDDGGHRVVLYGTSWCGACAQARAWFKANGIPFSDKDVEKDEKASAEMQRKMRRANMAFGGVPVIDAMGELMLGFDERKLSRLLKGP
jgi:glutaredoxin